METFISIKSFGRARLLVPAVLCLLAVTGALRPAHAQSLERIERERVQLMLSTIKSDIKKNYYDQGFRGMDIEARFKAADEKLKQATSLGQAFGILAQALLDLDDSHTYFVPPARSVTIEYGWQMMMIGDKAYVYAVRPGSDAEAKGLKVGDQVLGLEGFKPTRSDLWKMEYFFWTLSPRPGLSVVVQSPGGEPRKLDLAAKVKQEKRVLNLTGSDGGADIWDTIRKMENNERLDSHRFFEGGGMIIWRMPGFDFDPDQVDEIMDRVKGHSTLVLDLRGNPGGYVVTLERLAGYFFDHDVKIADLKGRKEMKPMLAKTQGKKIFDGKLVVLVDSRSASCAEMFARLVQLEKRGTVIGDMTAGAVMQAKYYSKKLGTDNLIYYGASITDADVIMSDGKSIEHIGVTPDELLLPTAAEMAAGRDPVLTRAAELAGVKLAPEKAGSLFPVEWRKL